MTEHKICKVCKWNKYPLCEGTKMFDGEFMNIEKLKPGFKCGQKDLPDVKDFSIKTKTELELKVEMLENKINELEEK